MRTRLKKIFLFSSLGSLLVGAGVAAVRRKARTRRVAPQYQRIPPDCPRVRILTEAREHENRNEVRRERYLLQRTPFKIWSVLDLPTSPGTDNPAGAAVYHVTWLELAEKPGEPKPEEREKGRFYGTIAAVPVGENVVKKNLIGRGALLQIQKCYVGGASNGVETGEIHRSSSPVLNYRFEYASEALA